MEGRGWPFYGEVRERSRSGSMVGEGLLAGGVMWCVGWGCDGNADANADAMCRLYYARADGEPCGRGGDEDGWGACLCVCMYVCAV